MSDTLKHLSDLFVNNHRPIIFNSYLILIHNNLLTETYEENFSKALLLTNLSKSIFYRIQRNMF